MTAASRDGNSGRVPRIIQNSNVQHSQISFTFVTFAHPERVLILGSGCKDIALYNVCKLHKCECTSAKHEIPCHTLLCCIPHGNPVLCPRKVMQGSTSTAAIVNFPHSSMKFFRRACNEFSVPTISTALSVRQRKWRCGKTPVSMRGGNIQQLEWWHFMVKPPLPCGTIKDCTY